MAYTQISNLINFLIQLKILLCVLCSLVNFQVLGQEPNLHAKLVLISHQKQRFVLDGKQCPGGVYTVKPKNWKCICVVGVWAVYGKYCGEPLSVVGGKYECFKVNPDMAIQQLVVVGDGTAPFKPSITIFREDYRIISEYFDANAINLNLDPSRPFLSISGHKWELESDSGDAVCLVGKNSSKSDKWFCYYHSEHWRQAQATRWNVIVKIRKGCRQNITLVAPTNCIHIPFQAAFPVQNGIEVCNGASLPEFETDENYQPIMPPLRPKRLSLEEIKEESPLVCSTSGECTSEPPLTLSGPESNEISSENMWESEFYDSDEASTTTERSTTAETNISSETSSTSKTTTESTPLEIEIYTCEKEITREMVKNYWTTDEARDCPPTTTQAVFINQLQRFAVKQMNKVFDTRVKSLDQASELLNLTLTLMTKVCPAEAVSREYLQDANDAFTMIIKEDFFYGVEMLDTSVFESLKYSLNKCIGRAEFFNLSMKERDCSNMEVTGKVVLPNGTEENILIPPEHRSNNFEPLLEAVWKMFLNAHAYCYNDFNTMNDFHRFSTFFFSLFSESVYEKWTSPLESVELYRFVTPSTNGLKLTMKNMDYCVGATNLISNCQTWLQRYSASAPGTRNKRSTTWRRHYKVARSDSSIWNGIGHCLEHSEDPGFKLRYSQCPYPI